ncbi:MAG: EAL domain-containing protein [Gammaproteobacteria bacterium]
MDLESEQGNQFKQVTEFPRLFRDIFENTHECVSRVDSRGCYLSVNQSYARTCGYEPQEMIGMDWRETVYPPDRPVLATTCQKMLEGGRAEAEVRGLRKNGTVFSQHVVLVKGLESSSPGASYYCFMKDITEQSLARLDELQKIRETPRSGNTKYQELIRDIDAIVWEARVPDLQFTFVSEAAEKILGYPVEEWYQPGFWLSKLYPEDRDETYAYCAQLTERGQDHELEYRMVAAEGSTVWLHDVVHVVTDAANRPVTLRGVMVDVSDLIRARDEIRAQEQRIHMIADALPASVSYIDQQLRYQFNNARFYSEFMDSPPHDISKTLDEIIGAENFSKIKNHIDTAFSGEMANLEFERVNAAGKRAVYDVTYLPDKVNGEVIGVYIVSNDITERKNTESALRKTNRALRVLSDCSDALVRIKDEQELLQSVCGLIVDSGGYRFAWVGFASQTQEKLITPVAHEGFEDGYLQKMRCVWPDEKCGKGPAGTAIRSGRASVVRNVKDDPDFIPWRDEALKRGYASCLALPLNSGASIFGLLAIYAPEVDAFDQEELALLERLADNLAFGIHAIRMGKKREVSENILALEHYAFQLIDSNLPLEKLLDSLVQKIESYLSDTCCSILLLDEEGRRLYHGAASGLNRDYVAAIDGVDIGACAGSCGTAVYRKERVIVTDISTDPLWRDYREVALKYGLRACHSTPIRGPDGKTLGTFANYYHTVRAPDQDELQLVDRMAHIIGGVIESKRATDAIKASQERFQLLSLATHDGVYDWDLKAGKVWKNEAYHQMFGIDEHPGRDEQWRGSNVHPDDRDPLIRGLREKFENKASLWTGEYRYLRADGSYADVLDRGYIIYDHNGEPVRMIGAMTDISRRKEAELAIQASEKRYRTLYDDSPSMFLTLNTDGYIMSVNKFGADHLGYQVDELLGRSVLDICAADDKKTIADKLIACVGDPEAVQRCEIRALHRYGENIWIRITLRLIRSTKDHLKILVTGEDISETRILSERLEYQGKHDSLTGLINRVEFERRLRRILASDANSAEHALCYLDLDQFKVINDTCGHLAGDELIRQLGELFSGIVRKRDTLARLGGDEFAVMMEDCALVQATRVAKDLLYAVEKFRFVWEGKRFSVGVSIGVVPLNAGDGTVNEVLSVADTACYAAKDAGRNRMHIYHPNDSTLSKRRGEMRWVAEINQALEDNRFLIAAQEIRCLGRELPNQKGKHYEILLRMRDAQGKIVPPGSFLPAAERYNLSVKLDRWVTRTVFNWLGHHSGELDNLALCSINLSGHSLGDTDFLNLLLNQFHHGHIPPGKICFEITETAAVANLGDAIRFIQTLKHIGCRFALDDFGAGLSSFTYLKNLPVDYLKIDGSFVREMDKNPVDLAMVRSINDIGKVMGKQTIAEFVENREIIRILAEIGVDYAQGYAIGMPNLLDLDN